jgi:hypothetical protein
MNVVFVFVFFKERKKEGEKRRKVNYTTGEYASM